MSTDNLESESFPQPEDSPADNSEHDLVFDRRFLEDLTYWVETNRKTALRVLSLVEEIRRNPFTGTGNPEKLRYQDANVWSRRINQTDLIVYVVIDNRIEFIQARYH